VTSYGQGYDRRDVVSKTEIRKFKYYNCPLCSCGQSTRKRLRRAHAVNYRRHERWWATPVVKSSKLVVSFMKLTKRVAGFVVFLIRPWSSPGLSRLGHRKDTLQCFFGTSDPLRLQTGHRLFCRCWTRDLHPSRVSPQLSDHLLCMWLNTPLNQVHVLVTSLSIQPSPSHRRSAFTTLLSRPARASLTLRPAKLLAHHE